MSIALEWDKNGERLYETGIDHVVLYPWDDSTTPAGYGEGVAFNGVSSLSETHEGGEANPIYADNIKYLNLFSKEEVGATLEAYTYPDKWAECDGSAEPVPGLVIGQQTRKMFGLSYRTLVGNDTQENDYGYRLHLLYGCKASPTEKAYNTVNDSPEVDPFSWEISTIPVPVTGHKDCALITIDSKKVGTTKMAALEAILYGVTGPAFDATKTYAVGDYCTKDSKVYVCTTAITTAGDWDSSDWTEVTNPGPRLPMPDEVITLLSAEG